MTGSMSLDEQQREAVTADVSARHVVIAGPGAGKTEVVGARCQHLVESEQAYPEQILLVSFSNAAVDVVRHRTAGVVDEGRGVDVCTLDSLAQRIRAELDPQDDTFIGYDAAIRRATALLAAAEAPLFPDICHVVVDEVQDVVGDRARFVLQLLRTGLAPDTGFTLLGDPIQALYDFQLADEDQMTSAALLDHVRSEFAAQDILLAGDYRAQTEDARRASRLRAELGGLPGSEQLLRLRRSQSELSPLGPLDDDAAQIIAGWSGSTALLCDTNARVALTADRLASLDLPTNLIPRAKESSIDPWVGRCLGDVTSNRIDHGEFAARLKRCRVEDVDGQWLRCLDLTGDPTELDLRLLGAALARPPRSFRRRSQCDVQVSTVHRAKGLEFDNVVLVDSEAWVRGSDTSSAHQLFVALSRARRRVTTVDGIDARRWRKDERADMWVDRGWNGRGGLRGVIIEPRHLVQSPLTAAQADAVSSAAVEWSEPYEDLTVDGSVIPKWMASVNGVTLGVTTEAFGVTVVRGRYGTLWPTLRGGRVEGVETAIRPGSEEFGQNGIALAARLVGHVITDWS